MADTDRQTWKKKCKQTKADTDSRQADKQGQKRTDRMTETPDYKQNDKKADSNQKEEC